MVNKVRLMNYLDETAKRIIYTCKACENKNKCKYKQNDGIPHNCPLKRG